MKGWSVQLRAVCVLAVATLGGCDGERRSAALPGGDTAAASRSDTAARPPDTAAAVAPDTVTRRDTAAPPAATPPVARTTRPKSAPKPQATPEAPAAAPTPDTAAAAAPASADTAPAATTPPSEASAPLRDQYHQAPRDTVTPVVYDGWKQYNLNCARCHGEDVQGTTIASHLIVSVRPDGPVNTKEKFIQTVCAGRPEKGMPAWCALGMDMATIEAIYEYVKLRSEGKIHPGRPARREG
jgi:hypothetical protein